MRPIFIGLSQFSGCRYIAEKSSWGRRISRRFVAGTDAASALDVTEKLNGEGFAVTLDYLGENVQNPDEACLTRDVYHELLTAIDRRGLDSHISLKLTQLGLDVDRELAQRLVRDLARHAAHIDSFVRIDMEDSRYTQTTLDLVRTLNAEQDCKGYVGAVIQSYLKRSAADVKGLVNKNIRIRLCKGAYAEPAELAFRRKSEVDAQYLALAQVLLSSQLFHAFATHDGAIIRKIQVIASSLKIDVKTFEFQMLYGIRRDLQHMLLREGHPVRIYVPFGRAWYPYFMRRLAERPANVMFLVKNILRDRWSI